MLWLKRWVALLLVVLVAGLTLVFVLENQSVARLQFMTLQSPALPLSVFVTAAFVAGGLVGLGLSVYQITHLRLVLARRRRELALCRQDVEQLRAQMSSTK